MADGDEGSYAPKPQEPITDRFPPPKVIMLYAVIKGLNRMARKCGLQLRQSYLRIAKRVAAMIRGTVDVECGFQICILSGAI